MAVNGKQKGAAYERTIAKDLSLWLSDGKKEDLFWRSAMSGGRSTVALRAGKKLGAQAGDISAVHKQGHSLVNVFMLECKFYKNLNYDSLIKGKGKLIEFWQIARVEARKYNKLPMLIAKQNNFPSVVCLNARGLKALGIEKLKLTAHEYDMHVLLWDDFLQLDPKVLREIKNVKKLSRTRRVRLPA